MAKTIKLALRKGLNAVFIIWLTVSLIFAATALTMGNPVEAFVDRADHHALATDADGLTDAVHAVEERSRRGDQPFTVGVRVTRVAHPL